ncbi:MAG: diguanylate cyclase [Planctomycetes bacterium]|nr:diguanylate cyclase [Planctomycetota bacterium]
MSRVTETYASLSQEDDLTGLRNRRFLVQDLSERLQSQELFSLLLLDFDRFQDVNEQWGNIAGDRVLRQFAERLREIGRETDLLVRYSGDSFCMLLPRASAESATSLAKQVQHGLSERPIDTGTQKGSIALTLSAAIAAHPQDGNTVEALLEALETAMYAAKKKGPAGILTAAQTDPALKVERRTLSVIPTPDFIGRKSEMTAADRFASGVRDGKAGVLLLYGDAGLGKTRFMRHLASRFRGTGLLYFYMSCNPLWRSRPGYGLVYLINRFFEHHPASQDRLRTVLNPVQRHVLRELVPAIASWQAEPAPSLTPANRTSQILEALEISLIVVTQEAPLVVLLDNMKALDRGTVDVLSVLLRENKARMGVIGSITGEPFQLHPTEDARLIEFIGEFQKRGRLWGISLSPFTGDDLRSQIEAILPGSMRPPGFDDILVERSRGNPLYIEEALRALMLNGRIRRESVFWRVQVVEPHEVPANLDAALAAVREHVSRNAREFLTNAAAVGTRFDVRVVQDLTGKREGEILDAVAKAVDAGVIHPAPEGRPDEYEFASDRVREAQIEAVPPQEREKLESRVTEVVRAQTAPPPDPPPPPPPPPPEPAPSPSPGGAPGPVSVHRARDLMTAFTEWVQRDRLFPQWAKLSVESLSRVMEALQALLAESPLVTFAVASPGLRLNDTPLDPLTGGEVVWDFATMLSERLILSVTFEAGVQANEMTVFARQMCAPMDIERVPQDYWEQALRREGATHIRVQQSRFVSYPEGETVNLLRGDLVGDRPLGSDATLVWPLLRALRGAAMNLRLYPPEHPHVVRALSDAVEGAQALLSRVRVVTFSVQEGRLNANGQALGEGADRGESARFLADELGKKGFRSLTLKDGLTDREVRSVASILSLATDDPAWATHVQIVLGGTGVRRFIFAAGGAAVTTSVALPTPAPEPVKPDPPQAHRAVAIPPTASSPPPVVPVKVGQLQITRSIPGPPPRVDRTPTTRNIPVPPASPAVPEAKFGEVQFQEIPETGEPVRLDVRARTLLKLTDEQFVSKETQAEYVNLLQALNQGWTQDLVLQLTERLGALIGSEHAVLRERSLTVARTALRDLKREPLEAFLSRLSGILRARIMAELDPIVQQALAETLRAWMSAAFGVNRVNLAAEMARDTLRPAMDSPKLSREFRMALSSKMRALSIDLMPPLLQLLVNGSASMREGVVMILGILGPAVNAHLVKLVTTSDNPEVRRAAARGLGVVGGTAQGELSRLVTKDGDPETLRRVLGVLELSGTINVVSTVMAAIEHPSETVRDAAFAVLERIDMSIAGPALKRLMAAPEGWMVARGIQVCMHRQMAGVAPEIVRMGTATQDEMIARACCEFFQAVPVSGAVAVLKRVFDMRPRLLKRGWSEDTRAAAVRAAVRLIGAPGAQDIVTAAKSDESPVIRRAAGA